MKPVRVGLLGCGNVGSALGELVAREAGATADRLKINVSVTKVAVRDLTKSRPAELDDAEFTTDAMAVATSEDVDLVVELIGGIDPARELVLAALAAGKPVVTGNKALLAEHGAELYAAAKEAQVDLLFEAAVAAAIPVVRTLRESLLGERITTILGIVNGTTNYILSQMAENGASYSDALAEAQRLGYAEADPTADVGGHDAAAKAAILATIAFGQEVTAADVFTKGISEVTADDIDFASRLGFTIKLLAIIDHQGDGLGVRVHPTMVPNEHPLASVRDSFNAIFLEGESADGLMLLGRGAGGHPTASAVWGDIIDAGLNFAHGTWRSVPQAKPGKVADVSELTAAYYISIDVEDAPGVLSEVSGVFGSNMVSIKSMEQHDHDGQARISLITHLAVEKNVTDTVEGLRNVASVAKVNTVMRVIADD